MLSPALGPRVEALATNSTGKPRRAQRRQSGVAVREPGVGVRAQAVVNVQREHRDAERRGRGERSRGAARSNRARR